MMEPRLQFVLAPEDICKEEEIEDEGLKKKKDTNCGKGVSSVWQAFTLPEILSLSADKQLNLLVRLVSSMFELIDQQRYW